MASEENQQRVMSPYIDASAEFTHKNCSNIDEVDDTEEKCQRGEARKRSFVAMENGLNLSLKPPYLKQKDACGNQSEISSTASCMPAYLGSSSSEEDESTDDQESSVLILMGCTRCLMYVMTPDKDPRCPQCNSSNLIDMFRRKSRKT